MKKSMLFLGLIIFFCINSCRNSNDDLQKIDQVINLYIKNSSGQDLLNSKISGSYTGLSINDVYGVKDNAPISSFSLKKDADTVTYMEYVAGAKRKLIDSSNSERKIYQSVLALNFVRKVNDTTFVKYYDTLKLDYLYTPSLFEISSAKYNNVNVFTKVEGQSNIIKVVK